MMLKRTFFIASLSTIALIATLIGWLPNPSSSSDSSQSSPDNSFAIRDARVFDGDNIIDRTTVIVRAGVIVEIGEDLAIPSNIRIIEGNGRTVLPGLIDAHTHTYGDALETSLRFGVTTNLDMFTAAQMLIDQRAKRERLAPTVTADLFSAGILATVDGGHGTQFGIAVETIGSPNEATAWVNRRKAEGSDFIKLAYMPYQNTLPSLDRATARAVILAAHDQGMKAVAHISSQRAATELLDEGIDGLVHVFADEPTTDEFARRAAQAEVFVIPTLTILASVDAQRPGDLLLADVNFADKLSAPQRQQLAVEMSGGWPGFDLAQGLRNTGILHQAGVTLLAGSDAPNPGTVHGASLHQELVYLVQAGLTPVEALRAASASPAAAFELSDRGKIATGARADLIMVDGDPITDINATRALRYVFKNGFLIEQTKPVKRAATAISSPILGDFENDLGSIDDWRWSATDDGLRNGRSSATVSHLGNGARDSAGAMAVSAQVRSGFFVPWAGAYLGPQEPDSGGVSLAGYQQIRFQIRGTPGTYRLMMFNAGAAGVPPSQDFQVSQAWNEVSLRLSDFAGLSIEQFAGLAITAGPTVGEFEYQLDQVRLE